MTDEKIWQRFTNPATRVVHYAQEETRRLGMHVVGTEHLLLGLLREDNGVAARILGRLGVDLGQAREELARQVAAPAVHADSTARLTLSSNAKKALEYALQEARELNAKLGLRECVDTEHLLLGLLYECSNSDCKATRLLEGLDVDLERVRKEVLIYLGATPSMTPAPGQETPDGDMWQRFTNPAIRAIHFAQEEARRLGMHVVGTEHLLLGLLREGEGVAARMLLRVGVNLDHARAELARQVGAPAVRADNIARLTMSPNAKKVLEYAQQEARKLNAKLGLLDFVDTEHLLLGLLRESSNSGSKAVRLLEGLGVDLDRVRKELTEY